jgi:hypothetical protein
VLTPVALKLESHDQLRGKLKLCFASNATCASALHDIACPIVLLGVALIEVLLTNDALTRLLVLIDCAGASSASGCRT